MEEIGARLKLRGRAEFQRDISAAGSALDGFGRMAKRVGIMAGAAIAGITAATVTMGVKGAAAWEQATVAFTTMLGNGGQARALMKELETFGIETPFEMPQLVTAARNLQAMGWEAEQLIPTLRVVGDSAAALGHDSDGVLRISRALGEMRAKGFASGEEMRQLANHGIRAWEYLANEIGETIPETMKMAEKRQIDGARAVSAIMNQMSKDHGGLMEAQMKTIQGQWMRLVDLVRRGTRLMVTPFLPALKWLLDKLSDGADKFQQFTEVTVPTLLALLQHGVRGGGINEQINDWLERTIWIGRVWNRLFDKKIENRPRAVARAIGRVIDPQGRLNQYIDKAYEMFGDIYRFIVQAIIPAFVNAANNFKPLLAPLALADDFLRGMRRNSKNMVEPLTFALTTVGLIVGALKLWSIWQGFINILTSANPYVIVLGAIVGIGLYLYGLYQRSESFQKKVDQWWQNFQENWDKMLDSTQDFKGWLGALESVLRIVRTIYRTLKKASDIYEDVTGTGSGGSRNGGFWDMGLESVPDFFRNLSPGRKYGIPGAAVGGRVTRGGPLVVGEDGPEIITQNVGATIIPLTNERVRFQADKNTVPARFEVTDGGRVLFELVRSQVSAQAARK